MIRLTLLLVAALGVVFAVAGQDPDRPEGSDQPGGIEVTRLDSSAPTAVARVPSGSAGTASDLAMAIPLDNQEAALQAALRATEAGQTPEPEPQTATARPAPEPAPTTATPPAYWYVTGNRVNLRSGPSTSTAVIGQVTRGQEALVLEQTADGWFRIETARSGVEGFIFGRFLSQVDPL